MKTSKIVVFAVVSLAAVWAVGLEIPLSGGGGGGKGVSVGFVDMDLVFQEFPETKKAKEDYYIELAAKREELAEHDKEMADLREQLAVLKMTLVDLDNAAMAPPAPPAEPIVEAPLMPGTTDVVAGGAPQSGLPVPTEEPPSAPAAEAPKARPSVLEKLGLTEGVGTGMKATLEQRQKLLEDGERALDEERKKAVADLKALEDRRAMQIFGKLYRALTQLAEEKGISLIVDKSSLLYGQAGLDLTESLSRRVRGIQDTTAQ